MDAEAIALAVEEVGRMIRADGGDLVLLDADPKTSRVRLQLRFDDVSCAECILPPAELEQTIRASIQRRVPGEFELLLDDPRS